MLSNRCTYAFIVFMIRQLGGMKAAQQQYQAYREESKSTTRVEENAASVLAVMENNRGTLFDTETMKKHLPELTGRQIYYAFFPLLKQDKIQRALTGRAQCIYYIPEEGSVKVSCYDCKRHRNADSRFHRTFRVVKLHTQEEILPPGPLPNVHCQVSEGRIPRDRAESLWCLHFEPNNKE